MTEAITRDFNTWSKQAIESAKRSSAFTYSPTISSSHLLLGLIQRAGIIRNMMQMEFGASSAGVTNILREQSRPLLNPREERSEFTEGALEVLDTARVLARQYELEEHMVTIEHVLLALVRVNDADFMYLLRALGVTASELEERAIQKIEERARQMKG